MSVAEVHGFFQFTDDLFEENENDEINFNLASTIDYEARLIYPMVFFLFFVFSIFRFFVFWIYLIFYFNLVVS